MKSRIPAHLALFALAAGRICMAQEGTRVFIANCQKCHDQNSDAHAPLPSALKSVPWQDIVKTLETGSMRAQGARLKPDERIAVARYLGAAGPAAMPSMSGFCPAGQQPQREGASWNGWSPDDANTRFQPASASGITAAEIPNLALKWSFGFPNAITAYGQPTIAGGRVFIGSNDGTVYALDANTGCLYWRYQAKAMVRDAVVIGPGPRAYFGDLESYFYSLDANTGERIWSRKLDDQPFTRITGTAKLHNGRIYVPIASQEENAGANPWYSCCTFRGNVVAVNAADGTEIWRTFTSPEPKPTRSKKGVQYYGPSGATIWSSPTIDEKRKLIYVATGNGYSDPDIKTADAIVAIDMESGAIRWSKQASPDMFNWDCGSPPKQGPGNCPPNPGTDVDFGASPILVDLPDGRGILLAGQKSGVMWGFDPDRNGETVWQTRVGKGGPGGGIQWGIAYSPLDQLVFAPVADSVRGKPASGGDFFALDAATGKIVWRVPAPKPACIGTPGCSAALRSPPAVIPGAVFEPSMDGHIRAFDTKSGKLIWDYDAVREFTTVNGIQGRGGSFSSTGVTVANGMIYVNSGYSSMPGNVLLAFSVR